MKHSNTLYASQAHSAIDSGVLWLEFPYPNRTCFRLITSPLERTHQDPTLPPSNQLLSQEHKRYMLPSAKSAMYASPECASRRTGHLIFTARPYHPRPRGWFYVSTQGSVILAASNKDSLLQYLVLAISRKTGHWVFSARIGVRLCRILDVNFGETPSTHFGE